MPEPATAPRPRVGVVVPAYRVEAFLGATLDSIAAQTVGDWECVVVDDGSPDASAAVAAEHAARDDRFRLVRQPNRGLSGARNTGVAHLSPAVTHVAFLDGDDVWVPTAVEQLLGALADDPGALGAWGLAELVDEEGEVTSPGLHPARQRDRRRVRGWRLAGVAPQEPLVFDEAIVISPMWPPAVVLHHRSTVEAVGAFDTSLRQLEDWDWYLRALRRGRYAPLQSVVAGYRVHAGQMTRRNTENVVYHDLVRRKAWEWTAAHPEHRRAVDVAWRQLQARRTARVVQRALRAGRAGAWRDAAQMTAAALVMAGQGAARRPPATRRWHVRWSRRHV